MLRNSSIRQDTSVERKTSPLRYDLSVPLCRVVAMYPQLPKPFKRYQIDPVWRAERPQKGRYRQFFQCDADTVGSESMLADAENVNLTYQVLTRLGFQQFEININDRKLITGIGQFAGVPTEQLGGLYRSIDKLDKIGLAGVRAELAENQIPDPVIEKLLALLEVEGDATTVLKALSEQLGDSEIAREKVFRRIRRNSSVISQRWAFQIVFYKSKCCDGTRVGILYRSDL